MNNLLTDRLEKLKAPFKVSENMELREAFNSGVNACIALIRTEEAENEEEINLPGLVTTILFHIFVLVFIAASAVILAYKAFV